MPTKIVIMVLPLEGIRVLDLSRILAGPYCTMILGDLGADVIKIEKPYTGDDTRAWGPPFAAEKESAYFLCANRNKKSITLNLKDPEGIKIIKELVKKSDILVENFPPGTMERLGLAYETLKELNHRLIYCSITGFGPDGPLKDKTGYDLLIQAMGGLMSITGEEGRPPVRVGVAIVDVLAGVYAQGAITSALYAREKTGKGQKIDISLLEVQVSSLINVGSSYLISGKKPVKWGSAHETIVPYQAFKAKDRYFVVCVGNDRLWELFCEAIGEPDLIKDPRFCTNPLRVQNRKELIPMLNKIFEKKMAQEWVKILESVSVPCGLINTVDEVFRNPQVLHREMLKEVEHTTAGRIKLAGIPVKYSATNPRIRLAPPSLGEHTHEILSSLLGYDESHIQQLREKGVI
jgi:crotonobetainyl-CoA:carnitine CoA-transferase CaiB-like acyl-CoA transferase